MSSVASGAQADNPYQTGPWKRPVELPILRSHPQTRPGSWRVEWLRTGSFVLCNLGVAGMLLGAPAAFDAGWRVMFWFTPDFAWPAAVCGAVAVIASGARLILTRRSYRAFRGDDP